MCTRLVSLTTRRVSSDDLNRDLVRDLPSQHNHLGCLYRRARGLVGSRCTEWHRLHPRCLLEGFPHRAHRQGTQPLATTLAQGPGTAGLLAAVLGGHSPHPWPLGHQRVVQQAVRAKGQVLLEAAETIPAALGEIRIH